MQSCFPGMQVVCTRSTSDHTHRAVSNTLFGTLQDASTEIDGHLNARLVQLDLGNIVPGSPPHSPPDRSAQGTNGLSPGRGGGAALPASSIPSSSASNLRSMSDMRKTKFKKLLDQQVGIYMTRSCPHKWPKRLSRNEQLQLSIQLGHFQG